MSATIHTWTAAGSPGNPYTQEACDTVCATCAATIRQPLARWSGNDVCAYHAANDLPWLRIYEQAEDPRLERSEFAFAAGGGDAIRRHGAWDAWRAAYPELWGRWQARWLGSNAE
jgi:3'-phosphoadenosine 5'-phosphosulfate sulfotransferase (PAPS reductase)/FAD synthetase